MIYKKEYKEKNKEKTHCQKVPAEKSIDFRPQEANERSEYGHWEEPHSYLLLGEERAVIIDTGLGVADIRKKVEQLTDLPVSVVTTHVHWDHYRRTRAV